VHLSRFKAIPGTGFENRLERKPERYRKIKSLLWDYKFARAKYRYVPDDKSVYRSKKAQLIKLVHNMNKRPLMDSAQ
jgi:anaerobic magnesium-protoporphyrin IX monomethyl ester cyclase